MNKVFEFSMLGRAFKMHGSKSWAILLETLQLTPSRKTSIQLLRSFIVSGLALVFDFGLLIVFKQLLGINYLIAATLSFSIGIVVNYILSVLWVFADHKLSSRHAEFLVFAVVNFIGLGLNDLIIASIVNILGLSYIIGKVVATIVVFFWNFIIRKKLLY